MVSASGLSKSFASVQVLKESTFSLSKGTITALAGPNGAGKTTLLKIVAQVLKPDTGTVTIEGGDARDFMPYIGYVPQQNAFFYELTVKDNLDYWFNQKDGGAYRQTVERLELAAVMQKKASSLSGGMQRRLNMAIALVNSPRLLIMDEPLTGVDIATRLLFMDWMRLFRQAGLTVFYSTHHTDEIIHTADALMLMRNGEIAYTGEISDTTGLNDLISGFRF